MSRALSPLPGPAALSSCRKFQKLSIIPAQRAVRAAKAPRRRATCRPAARPALAPPSTLAEQPRRAGRGPDWPPLPAPRARRNAWQPRPRAILSGSEAAQPRCFRLFPGRGPASPGPRLPADWGVESRGGANWGTSRPGSGSGSGPGPGGVRRRSGPALSAEARRADY